MIIDNYWHYGCLSTQINASVTGKFASDQVLSLISQYRPENQ